MYLEPPELETFNVKEPPSQTFFVDLIGPLEFNSGTDVKTFVQDSFKFLSEPLPNFKILLPGTNL